MRPPRCVLVAILDALWPSLCGGRDPRLKNCEQQTMAQKVVQFVTPTIADSPKVSSHKVKNLLQRKTAKEKMKTK